MNQSSLTPLVCRQTGHQLGFQRLLRRFELVNDLLVLGHQLFRITVVDLHLVGVLAVEIVIALSQLFG